MIDNYQFLFVLKLIEIKFKILTCEKMHFAIKEVVHQYAQRNWQKEEKNCD